MSLHDIWRGDVMPLSGVAVSIGRNTYDPPAPVVPVYDIHARTLILHDSKSPTGSGIIRFNADSNRLELIPTNPIASGMQPIVTAVVFDAYNVATSTISSSATTLNLDTTRYNSHSSVYVLNSSDEVQINMAGTYEFEYGISLTNITTATRTTCLTYVEKQSPGGAYAEIAGTRAWTYNRQNGAGEDTANARFILNNVVVGDKFRLIGQITAGTASITQVANGTRFTIKKLA